MSDLKTEFAALVKQYVEDLNKADPKDAYTLLDDLVTELYDRANSHWYSSSRDC